MICQLRNEMRRCEFCGELFLPRLRPLAIDELEEIESDPNTLHADQVRDVLDVIGETIECAFFLSRANEDGVVADDAARFTDHLVLFVANVALYIVIPAYVRVGHNGRLRCDAENLVKPGWIDVREINHYPKRLAFAHYIPTKRSENLWGRAAVRENTARSRCACSRVR